MRTHDLSKAGRNSASEAFRQPKIIRERTRVVPFAVAARRFVAPLELRPMLWMACCALLGVALGSYIVHFLCGGNLTILERTDLRLFFPFVLAVLAGDYAWEQRANPILWRIGVAFSLIFFFAFGSAYRIAPPRGDISELAQVTRSADPVWPRYIKVQGIVTDFPKRNEFSTQFPLECYSPQLGRVWVHAKATTHVNVGDEISLNMQILPLAMPSNPGQNASYWSLLGSRCWSEGRRVNGLTVLRAGYAMPFERLIGWWREVLFERYKSLFRGDGSQDSLTNRPYPTAMAQIVTAMVFGEGGLSQPLPRSIRDDFRVAGLSHLLVASGTQVSVLVLVVFWLLGKLYLRPTLNLAFVLPVVMFYAFTAGSAPSIWRAAIIGVLVALALCFGRPADGLSLWGAAILLLLIFDPLIAWSLSFQLTFAATWGLLVLAPALARLWNSEERGTFAQGAAFTLGAQLATMPITLVHFGTMSIAGFAANFVALPIAGALMFFGVFGFFFSFLEFPIYFLSRLMVDVAHGAASFYGASWEQLPAKNSLAIGFYVLMGLAILPLADGFPALADKIWREGIKRLRKIGWWPAVGALLFFGALLAWKRYDPNRGTMRVVVLDVGQGNATLLISPENRAVLFGGGSDESRSGIGASVILPALQSLRIERLEAIVLTDTGAKNNSALPEILREVPVGMVIDATRFSEIKPVNRPNLNPDLQDLAFPDYRATLREAARQKIRVTPARKDQELRIDGVTVRIIATSSRKSIVGNPNGGFGYSCEYGKNRVFIAGNLDAKAQNLLAQRKDLRSDVLVVGNNGVEGSTTAELLRATAPAVALLPVGRYNREKAPAYSTVNELEKTRAQLFRTDYDGALTARCNGQGCTVTPTFEWGDRN